MRSGWRGQTGGPAVSGNGWKELMRRRAGSRSVLDRDRGDDDVLDGAVARTRRDGDDRVDDGARHVVGHLAEDRVLAGQPRGRGDGDEELRAVGAARLAGDRVPARAGVGHREQVRLGEAELGVDLVVEVVARAAGTGAQGVATLDHEAGDHTVEDHTVVQRVGALCTGTGVLPGLGTRGQAGEVLHRLGRVVREELDPDVTGGRVQRREHGDSVSRGRQPRRSLTWSTPRLASSSARSFPTSPACRLTHCQLIMWRATSASRACHSSAFLTGFLSAVRHPLRFQPASHDVMPFMTYCESMLRVTVHGRLRARRPSMTAVSSMRLLVVSSSPPKSSRSWVPDRIQTPQPPTPGLPLQAPSVHISTTVAAVASADG